MKSRGYEGRVYSAPDSLRRRLEVSGGVDERHIAADTESTGGVELHKESKFYQQWEEFKNNNQYVNKAGAFFGFFSWIFISAQLTMDLLALRRELPDEAMPYYFVMGYVLIGMGFFCGFVNIVTTLFLKRGLRKNKPHLVRWYLIIGPFFIIVNLLMVSVSQLLIRENLLLSLTAIAGVCTEVYFFLVIRSAYEDMVVKGKAGIDPRQPTTDTRA